MESDKQRQRGARAEQVLFFQVEESLSPRFHDQSSVPVPENSDPGAVVSTNDVPCFTTANMARPVRSSPMPSICHRVFNLFNLVQLHEPARRSTRDEIGIRTPSYRYRFPSSSLIPWITRIGHAVAQDVKSAVSPWGEFLRASNCS